MGAAKGNQEEAATREGNRSSRGGRRRLWSLRSTTQFVPHMLLRDVLCSDGESCDLLLFSYFLVILLFF